MKRSCLSILIFLLSSTFLVGQTADELRRKQQKLKEEIDYKKGIIVQLEKDSKNTLSYVKLTDKKIQQRQELIGVLLEELNLIDRKIEETEDLIVAFESDIEQLREEYAQMISQAYKTRNNADKAMYIFASKDFEQAFRRMKYMQQLTEYRQEQAEAILSAQANLEKKRLALETQREEKNAVLNNHNQEKLVLNREKQDKQKKLKQLGTEEAKHKRELAAANKKAEEVRMAIKKAIEREMAKSGSGGSSKSFKLTPEARELSNNFVANKGKLPWPVDKGEIVDYFGEQPHPFLKGIKVKNNGVTVSTTSGSRARAVFEGEVSKVLILPGSGKVVIVRHGEFITVYTNLKETFVSNGDKVRTKEEIGIIVSDKGKTEFEFQLWKGTELLNPIYWIYGAK
ncbi:MAG: peptidoglycan DD-metalloendopeptidase family protein [Flavobacteriales bacterium]|jgi:murein hydrolase activator|nr:peptidoglycan DD-metalloendopeptidase family protein [Flavobacteriales bacterium]